MSEVRVCTLLSTSINCAQTNLQDKELLIVGGCDTPPTERGVAQ